jgi:hypothetical protein
MLYAVGAVLAVVCAASGALALASVLGIARCADCRRLGQLVDADDVRRRCVRCWTWDRGAAQLMADDGYPHT